MSNTDDTKTTASVTPPTEDQIAQAFCLSQCSRGGFLGCTWNGVDACIDADAAHYHGDARAALESWDEGTRL